MDNSRTLRLNTGALMPLVGLGTWKAPPGDAGAAVQYAIEECGYRHIDCAAAYGNEKEIGAALSGVFKRGRVRREEIFITSKLWNAAHAREDVRPACEATLRNLQLDYLDLYLVHWALAEPKNAHVFDADGNLVVRKVPIRETWEEMEALVRDGLVKAVGVSNFTAPLLLDLLSFAVVPPAVNQIELHPYLQQTRLVDFCRHLGMQATAYCPLSSPGLMDEQHIRAIAEAHGKTPAQILIRWAVQRGTIVIPKSTHPERVRENVGVFDFELSEDEMGNIATLERRRRVVDPYTWGHVPYFD